MADVGKTSEKYQWEKIREDLLNIEKKMSYKLQYHEKNPEKHPSYPIEWKIFWNRRYKELVEEGKDAAKHDFKPEWIAFWNIRMAELHEEELNEKREKLKAELQRLREQALIVAKEKKDNSSNPVDASPSTPEKNTKPTKRLSSSDIKNAFVERPRSTCFARTNNVYEDPQFEESSNDSPLIALLQTLTVLEDQLGSSLGPRIMVMLSQALSLDMSSCRGSMILMKDPQNSILIETVRQKLKGLLFAGVVKRNLVNTTRKALSQMDVLQSYEQLQNAEPITVATTLPAAVGIPRDLTIVDRAVIAQQIATALVAQGKTDVTHEDLEKLVNAFIEMAQANSVSKTIQSNNMTEH